MIKETKKQQNEVVFQVVLARIVAIKVDVHSVIFVTHATVSYRLLAIAPLPFDFHK